MGQASREKKARKAQKWELLEKTVRLLYQSLLPGARIERDQDLPNHKTAALAGEKPLTRQCDVVIWLDGPHGESFWIVEVQKRGKKVAQSEYDGWVSKMDQVGAAGLIGVAEKGFPRSALLAAKTHGPRVKLFTLPQLEGEDLPVRIVGNEVIISGMSIKMKFLNTTMVVPKPVPQGPNMPIDERRFRRGNTGEAVLPRWLSQMASTNYRHLYRNSPEGTIPNVEWEFTPPPEWCIQTQNGKDWYPVSKLKFTSDLIVKYHRLPLTCSGYKPVEFGPILAYALTAGGKMDGEDLNMRIIVRKDANGKVYVLGVEHEGFPDNSLVEFGFSTGEAGTGCSAEPYHSLSWKRS